MEGTSPCHSWSAFLVEARPGLANLSPGAAFKAPALQMGVLSSDGGRISPGRSALGGPLPCLSPQGFW